MTQPHTSAAPNLPSTRDSGPALRSALEKLGWAAVLVLMFTGLSAILGRGLFLIEALALAPADPDAAFNAFDVRYYNNPLTSFLHLIPGALVALLGPLQFIPSLRKKHLRWHRLSGRIYVVAGATGAITGFLIGALHPFMGFNGVGFNEAMATAFFSALVLLSLGMAVYHVRHKRIGLHREWMIRGFALLLAIATERLMLTAMMALLDIEIGILFGTSFWMAGLLHLAVAEYWISLTRTPAPGNRHWKDLDSRVATAE